MANYVPGTRARRYVQHNLDFTNSSKSLAGTYIPSEQLYAVTSYDHWFLFIYSDITGQWYECSDKYSVTTSKHHSQTHPLTDTIKLTQSQMTYLYRFGPMALTKYRLTA